MTISVRLVKPSAHGAVDRTGFAIWRRRFDQPYSSGQLARPHARERVRFPRPRDTTGTAMGKFFRALRAQLNKIANIFFEADPIAVMQLEVDQATERLKEGRKGLEMYRGLVETVARQVATGKSNIVTARVPDQSASRRPAIVTWPANSRSSCRRRRRELAEQRAAAPDARAGLPEQPAQDSEGEQRHREGEGQDPAVPRGAEDERRRGRDRADLRVVRHERDDGLRRDRAR